MAEVTRTQLRIARETGDARRCLSYNRTNPYPPGPLADAFDAAWVARDIKLGCDGNGKSLPEVRNG